jgi:hypothetical protein
MVGVSLTWLLHFMGECFATCPIMQLSTLRMRLQTNNTAPIIKTNDELVEQRDTPNQVKSDTQVIGKANPPREAILPHLHV